MKNKGIDLRHVQVPDGMCGANGLEPFDLYVYAMIKRFMNRETREAYPSLAVLKKVSGCGQDRITGSIGKLRGRYLGVYYRGRKRVFVFPGRYRNFEPFSYGFLDKGDLTPTEKAYVIASQQFMFKDLEGYGKVGFSARDLSALINMPEWEIRRHDRDLAGKGYLSVVPTGNRDFETGLPLRERVFDMGKLGQGLIWSLGKGTGKARGSDVRIARLRKDIRVLRGLLAQGDGKGPVNAELRIEL